MRVKERPENLKFGEGRIYIREWAEECKWEAQKKVKNGTKIVNEQIAYNVVHPSPRTIYCTIYIYIDMHLQVYIFF